MFSVFSKFFSHYWDASDAEENKNVGNKEGQDVSKENGEESDLKLGSEGFVAVPTSTDQLQKCCSGRVTTLYDDSGIIDEEIFFSFEAVIGGLRPKLNTEVHVEATRSSLQDGWRASRVELVLDDWNRVSDEATLEILIGEITDTSETTLVVNGCTSCDYSCLAFGYVPSHGDWVRVEVLKDRGVVYDVKSVAPLRERTLTGCVTAVNQGHGYIDRDIFFSFGACPRNYVPRKGHYVTVTAIESNQGKCKWRAISIQPKPPSKGANHLNFPQKLQSTPSKFTQELLRDKEGITITENIDFGNVVVGEKNQEKIITIRNFGQSVTILQRVEGVEDNSAFSIGLISERSAPTSSKDHKDNLTQIGNLHVQINPNEFLKLAIDINPRFLGAINHLVVFNFGSFQIGRYFAVNVEDRQQQYLQAKSPYQKRQFVDKKNALANVVNTRNSQQWVIPGERPMFKRQTINISTKLKQYDIPRTLRQFILEKMDLCCLVPSVGQALSMRNYQERFSALLHAEEVQMELEMREFDLEHVSLKGAGEFLSLAVPGLAEGRPSLLIGDRVILAISGGSSNTPKYEGFIHEVLSDEILLRFHDEFHITYDMDFYDVMFFFNRTPLRRAHRAVELAYYLGEKVLFPTHVVPTLPQISSPSKTKQEYYNSKLNERQKAAVNRILSGQCRPMPYILFGPPGTGKTVTLVEAVLQVFHRIGSCRILACAPSNSAADLIVERLHQSGVIAEGDMVRLNAFQRQQNIPEGIENYSISIERLDIAAHYRILVCTCTTAGQMHHLGLSPGHFTHVFIDEAGQATEPESLVPISFLAGTDGQTILAGDPCQLGAVLRSSVAKNYGLNISLLERLMSLRPYLRNATKFSNHGFYDPLAVTKLINNYRSHDALLRLPSKIFYHSELVACADETLQTCLCDWDVLTNKNGFPILFHGAKGEDLREGNSPSWFNAVEAVQVIRYVQDLRSFNKKHVELSHIGIITPYRKQVEKIRLLLERLGLSEVKVGSVEEFQGQERLVIIISTVRSCSNLLSFDYVHNLGFLSNPKRFNVAITRAQALMIIIGNPHVLSQDTNWKALLRYCVDNNAYVGCDLPDFNDSYDDDTIDYDCNAVHATFDEGSTARAQNSASNTEQLPEVLSKKIRLQELHSNGKDNRELLNTIPPENVEFTSSIAEDQDPVMENKDLGRSNESRGSSGVKVAAKTFLRTSLPGHEVFTRYCKGGVGDHQDLGDDNGRQVSHKDKICDKVNVSKQELIVNSANFEGGMAHRGIYKDKVKEKDEKDEKDEKGDKGFARTRSREETLFTGHTEDKVEFHEDIYLERGLFKGNADTQGDCFKHDCAMSSSDVWTRSTMDNKSEFEKEERSVNEFEDVRKNSGDTLKGKEALCVSEQFSGNTSVVKQPYHETANTIKTSKKQVTDNFSTDTRETTRAVCNGSYNKMVTTTTKSEFSSESSEDELEEIVYIPESS